MLAESSIGNIERWLGRALPRFYRDFLKSHMDQIVGNQVLLYGPENVIERNETYQVQRFLPGYVAVGDDSGGRAVIISLEKESRSVFLVGFGDLDPDGFEFVTDNFDEWVRNGCPVT